jgi:nicotinamide mononucleotide (NMN) deamidase PncC
VDLAGLAAGVISELASRQITLSCVDAYTAGRLAQHLQRADGSGATFRGGLEFAAPAEIETELGLSAVEIGRVLDPDNFGRGAGDTAVHMAEACQRRFDSDIAVSIFAVPEPDNPDRYPPLPIAKVTWVLCQRCHLPVGRGAMYQDTHENMQSFAIANLLKLILERFRGSVRKKVIEPRAVPSGRFLDEAEPESNASALDEMLRTTPPNTVQFTEED